MKSLKGLTAAVLLAAGMSYGAGFSILEQSANGLGRALAGMTVDTEDPASLYFNPASPAWFENAKIMIGNHIMHVNATYTEKESGLKLGHDEGGDAGGWVFIPNMYYVQPISSTVSFGIGVSATSGTRTAYNPHWLGRYTATETEISVMDINPVLSWKVTDNLSIGIGLAIEYADATMAQQVDLSGVGLGDGQMKMTGDSYAFGFTAGILYEPIEGTKLGLGYRSRMTHDLDLKARVRGADPLKAFGMNTRSDADAELNLPSIINFGIEQKINDKLDVMMDVSWSEWSVMEELTVDFDKPILNNNGDSVEMKWRDNWRFALGASYALNEKITLRGGVAFDETPVQDDYRNTRLPDANRYWICLGLGYQYNEHVKFDLGYLHIFFESVSLSHEDEDPEKSFKGKVRGSCDIFSFAMTYTF